MKITQAGSNQTILHTDNGTQVLFSYETPVAATLPDGTRVQTEKKYSNTTSRHISANGYKNAQKKPQEFLNQLV